MIFIGDIACPSLKVDSFISSIKNLGIFKNEIVVLNLEANILDEKENKRSLTLFNSPKVIDAFTDAKKVIVTMANNHMYDYPSKIQITASYLRSKNIGVFGICEKTVQFFLLNMRIMELSMLISVIVGDCIHVRILMMKMTCVLLIMIMMSLQKLFWITLR